MLDPPFPPVQCCSTKGVNVDHVRVCVVFMDISTLIGGRGDGGGGGGETLGKGGGGQN